jgi:hypothetical protein
MDIEFRKWVVPAVTGVVSLCAGAVGGHILTKRQLKNEKQQTRNIIEDLDSRQLELSFERVELTKEVNHMLQETAHIVREMKEQRKDSAVFVPEAPNHWTDVARVIPNESAPENPLVTIFKDLPDDDWDYVNEVAQRTEDAPYIIHRDEYFAQENEYKQVTIMYYEGDQVLCDEQDVPIYNPEKVVGQLEFGKGSQDQSIVYIRNDKLEVEFEVILDHGFYQVEVLGAQVETQLGRDDLKHSVHKFRME